MKISKIVKRIVAIGTGVTMLGATVLGAMATDLNAYPNPMFIKDGKFNGLIVIGAEADTQDMLGAMDIISSLQATTIGLGNIGASIQTIGDIYEFSKASDKLNLNESLRDIRSTISKTQLPIVLADGVLSTSKGTKFDYEQQIVVGTDEPLQFFADKDYKNDQPTIGIKVPRNEVVFTYSLEFNKPAVSTEVDDHLVNFEDRTLQMLGENYDITSSSDAQQSLTLMRGALKPTLEEGETQTYTLNNKKYEVTALIIEDTNSRVKFKVNGEVTDVMSEGDVFESSDGTMIGVREVIPNEAGDVTQDMVEFYIGAKKIVLENGAELNIDDEDISNIDVTITGLNGADLEQIDLTWTADDDLFLTEDKNEIVMPGLESVKFYMDGFYRGQMESTTIEPSSDDTITLSAPLTEYDVELDILFDNNGDGDWDTVGQDDDAKLITQTCGDFVVNMDTDTYFVVTHKQGKEGTSEVLQLTKVDDVDGITIKNFDGDVIADNKKPTKSFDAADMTVEVLNVNETNSWANLSISDGDCKEGMLITKAGLQIELPTTVTNATTFTMTVTEEDADETIGNGVSYDIDLTFDTGDEATVDFKGDSVLSNGESYSIDNSNVYEGYIDSDVSSKIIEDKSSDQADLEIIYPGEETYGNLFIGSKASKVIVSNTTDVSGKIEVGAAIMDTSLTNYKNQNLIVIGGPAINKAAASLLGKTYPSFGIESGIPENAGMIKLIQQTDGSIAMIVAGWDADDTQRACRVVAENNKYTLSGNEVVVTGTTMTDITVGIPTVV